MSIPTTSDIGANGLDFVDDVRKPVTAATTRFTFSFDRSEISLIKEDKFNFVIT